MEIEYDFIHWIRTDGCRIRASSWMRLCILYLYFLSSDNHPRHLQLKNLSAMEANIVRPFVTKALETFYKLSSSDMIQESDHVPNRQPQATNRGPRVSHLLCFALPNFASGDSNGQFVYPIKWFNLQFLSLICPYFPGKMYSTHLTV